VNKVLKAVYNMIPERCPKLSFQKKRVKGEYGNQILIYRTRINKKEILDSVLKRIGSMLSDYEKDRLREDIKSRIDGRSLYLRFDKQAACNGRARFHSEDSIHIRIRFRTRNLAEIKNVCENVGILI